MKKSDLLSQTAVLALAASAFVTSHANASTSPGITTYTTGDLIFGAEDFNGVVTNNLEVDIGSINTFIAYDKNNPAGTVINVANLNPDLTSTFGSDYFNVDGQASTDVQWGIVGTSGNNSANNPTTYALNTYFLSNPETSPGTMGSGGEFYGNAGSAAYDVSQITSMTGSTGNSVSQSVFTGETRTGSGLDATIVPDSGLNSYDSREAGSGFQTGDADLNDFTGELTGSGEAGPTYSVSDLDVVLPVNGSIASDIGAFEFSNSGELEFVTVGVIPEPSTFALLAFGALVAAGQLLRRSSLNS